MKQEDFALIFPIDSSTFIKICYFNYCDLQEN